jgi:hypothetical protein
MQYATTHLTRLLCALLFLISFLISTHGYSQLILAAPGEVEGAIKLRMMPFYGYEGQWHAVFKEVNESGDTVVHHAAATLSITRDSVRFKRDSSELRFDFQWESPAARKFVDIQSMRLWYSWDTDKYIISLEPLPKSGLFLSYGCWPTFDFQKRELFYEKEDVHNPFIMTHWKLFDERIAVELKTRNKETNTVRWRKIVFDRIK